MIEPLPAVDEAADKTVLPPVQNDVVPVIVAVGFALTVTLKVVAELAAQPFTAV